VYGVHAGTARGIDGAVDYTVEVVEAQPDRRLTWQEAQKWAESVGGALPTRREAALLFANVPELFETDYGYWTSERYAGGESYAWCQWFSTAPSTTTPWTTSSAPVPSADCP
jgi:hypothetical protein